ncbi:hypothetical protein AVEN_224887-1 [Araneus ventricosus]|uniref:Uncharacterized protein n=1 Tax=Araneus ventricosus TaxID=182803 RepID=A0A4Y2PLJ0_ARAVE|nr:hypothetical protein AVEN_224887-1 [Araneus ventricosus]
MAEGGVPLDPESEELSDEEVEEFDSLDLLFARDFITYVMKRRIPDWTFGEYYARPCPVTPFSYRIRHAVDFFLNKECINLDSLFHASFVDEHFDYGGFIRVVDFIVESVFNHADSHNDLLRFLCLHAHFTAMAYKRGVRMAPYYALFNIKDLLGLYTHKKGISSEYFFGEFGFEVMGMIHENKSIVFH